MARRLLFVARDGALVERGAGGRRVDAVDDVVLAPAVIPALLRFVGAGYEIVVLDDAPGGPTSADAFVETLLASQGVRLAAARRCTHAGRSCDCARPGLGLVREYLAGYAMDRERSAVVGDGDADLALAANMGVAGFRIAPGAEPGGGTGLGAGPRGGTGPGAGPRGGTSETTWAEVAHALLDRPRTARVARRTRETDIEVEVDLDREGEPRASTGIGFFDHMLEQLGKHAGIALAVTCRGDLEIDEHHTVEDVALALGQALKQALGDKRGIGRYGFVLPMDEAEAEVSIDLGGRPYLVFEGELARERVGELPTELVPHFFRSLAETLGAAVHVRIRGENAHHMVEASFKGLARALRQACARTGETLPSTKGVL
ncbi:MAG TPA: imidazoleglycerol-phosphate dehydratase HisB [Gammaproteobacteria bacterium]|nr:imidazoleglycerol-phosphate dehydratase HisB [Gammaproteobacteria bacterium]